MDIRLAYLHLNLASFNGQGQEDIYFDRKYLKYRDGGSEHYCRYQI